MARPYLGFKAKKFKKKKEAGIEFLVKGGDFTSVAKANVLVDDSAAKATWSQDADPKPDGQHLVISLTHEVARDSSIRPDDPISGQITITITDPDHPATVIASISNAIVYE